MGRTILFVTVLTLLQSIMSPTVQSSDVNPPLPKTEDIAQLPDVDLAFSFLVATEMLNQGIGVYHQVWADARAKGDAGLGSVAGFAHMPDGTVQEHVFRKFEDLDGYVGKIRDFHELSKAEIFKRGFETVEKEYSAIPGKECSSEWPTKGKVTTDRIEFYFVLLQGQKSFMAAVTRSAVAMIFPGGFQPPLFGTFNDKVIDLRDAQEKCSMRLVPAK